MSRQMIIEEVRDGGNVEVARIQSGEVIIGREPERGIKLGAHAVSRDHGAFLRVRNHWFYRDLGSTNGSWLNGVQLSPNQWQMVRSGDYLQLADVALKVRSEGESGGHPGITDFQSLGGRSLIVFVEDQFADEFPVPEYGRALVIGGSEADIDIPGDVYELPALVVERRGNDICTFSVAKQISVVVNGVEISETTRLSDGDHIKVSNYTVLVNDPATAKGMTGRSASEGGGMAIGNVKEWGSDDRSPDFAGGVREAQSTFVSGTGQFGRQDPENSFGSTETMAINPEELEITGTRSDMHPSMRHLAEDSNSYTFNSVEDKVIILIGLMLMMLLVVLVVWWVFI